jgi:hypothetical protein
MEDNSAAFIFKEKRKWQLALRRYILQGYGSFVYAPYFGIDAENFRKWIALQFNEEFSWKSFSSNWQFDHIIPVAYFDLTDEEDLKLCWNFTNIRIEKSEMNKNRGNRVDILTAKAYFEDLYNKTEYFICKKMVEKINSLEISLIESTESMKNFLLQNKDYLETIRHFSEHDYNELNTGKSSKDILLEKAMFEKFGKE